MENLIIDKDTLLHNFCTHVVLCYGFYYNKSVGNKIVTYTLYDDHLEYIFMSSENEIIIRVRYFSEYDNHFRIHGIHDKDNIDVEFFLVSNGIFFNRDHGFLYKILQLKNDELFRQFMDILIQYPYYSF